MKRVIRRCHAKGSDPFSGQVQTQLTQFSVHFADIFLVGLCCDGLARWQKVIMDHTKRRPPRCEHNLFSWCFGFGNCLDGPITVRNISCYRTWSAFITGNNSVQKRVVSFAQKQWRRNLETCQFLPVAHIVGHPIFGFFHLPDAFKTTRNRGFVNVWLFYNLLKYLGWISPYKGFRILLEHCLRSTAMSFTFKPEISRKKAAEPFSHDAFCNIVGPPYLVNLSSFLACGLT